MRYQSLKCAVMSFALLTPTLSLALSCQSIMNTINKDIEQYDNSLSSKSLSWMNLTWLQKSLGRADSKENVNDQFIYEWRCEDDLGLLKATVNTQGQLLHLDGQYVSENGSGVFSTDVPVFLQPLSNSTISTPRSQQASVSASLPTPPVSSQNQNYVAVVRDPNESACDQSVRQISNDISFFATNLEDKTLPWMSLTWLNLALGSPVTTSANAYLYQWEQYQLYITADGRKEHVGELPNQKLTESLDEITSLLGIPTKVHPEELTRNTWRCPINNGSALTVWMNKNNQIAYLSGKACTVDRCKNFETEIHVSELQKSLRKLKPTLSKYDLNLSVAKLQKYNDHFKTSLGTVADLHIDINKRIKSFYNNLRLCVPGVYEYAVPVANNEFLFNTTSIHPEKTENRCIVETRYAIPHIGAVTLKCRYEPNTLQLFNDNQAEYIAKGQTSFNAGHPTPLQIAEENECKRYINGVL